MIEVIGWTGVIAYTIAYAFLSLGWMSANRMAYHAWNALGGICLVIISYDKDDTPNLVVNLLWIIIASISLIRIGRMRNVKQSG